EPHAAVAHFHGDELTVHLSTQSVFHVRALIASRYGLPVGKVTVIAEHVGGGFGSKGGLGNEAIAAIDLARAAGKPGRVAYERHEEPADGGYRPRPASAIAFLV